MVRKGSGARGGRRGTGLRRALLAVLVALGATVALSASAQTGARRIALLIADGNYDASGAVVPPAAKDAQLLLGELTRARFDADLRSNLDTQDMRAALDAFMAKIGPGSVALLYFTGLGLQSERRSYLIPVDARIATEADIKREGIDLDGVLAEMDRRGAQVKIAIVDASRRNPFERQFRGFFAGLAAVDAPEGTLALFSAAPGRLGVEDSGDVSLFMGELTKEMRSPGISAEEAFTHARIGVSRASNGEQIPWVASSLVDDFSFGEAGSGGTVQARLPTPPPAPPPAPPEPVKHAEPKPAADRTPDKPAGDTPAPPPRDVTAINGPSPPKSVVTPAQDGSPPAPPDGAPGKMRDCADCPPMIVLPPGSFTMGAGATPFDKPAHKVTFAKPFAIGETEVTFDEWQKCVEAGGCTLHPDDRGWGGGDRPVINVSWSDAQQYVGWLSKVAGKAYRLPSEAEWEYAARGGRGTPFAWGPSVGSGLANCRDCQSGAGLRTTPARSFPPNDFGLYDMAGNAAEWVLDCWHETYRGAPQDGSAWTSGTCDQRVLRGGSFDSASAYIKPAARFRYDADVRYFANGFRVARPVP